jgi:hypothetical protein
MQNTLFTSCTAWLESNVKERNNFGRAHTPFATTWLSHASNSVTPARRAL